MDVKSDGRKKARLVAKGFSQVEGIDYDQIFSPVVRFQTVRLILTLAALKNWYITGLDVRNTYLYGKLDEEIYMEQPEGFVEPGKEDFVLLLLKALHGLKQVSRYSVLHPRRAPITCLLHLSALCLLAPIGLSALCRHLSYL